MVRHEVGCSPCSVKPPFLIADTLRSRLRRRWVPYLHHRASLSFRSTRTTPTGACGRRARLRSRRLNGITPMRERSTGIVHRPHPSSTRVFRILVAHLRLMCIVPSRTYTSIDPAPPSSKLLSGKAAPEDTSDEAIAALKHTLLDASRPLFERYRAMFALRNIGTPAAVEALAAGFTDDSALFKYVRPLVDPALLADIHCDP